MTKILEVNKIHKSYGPKNNRTRAINGISFEVDRGEFVGIMGPSGSGKSTLLNCISTIDEVTDGEIRIENRDITTLKNKEIARFRRENLGFIFQHFNLLDTLTAYENIALALSVTNCPVKDMAPKIQKIAELLDIGRILHKHPYEMSGGQQQRVSAARAIVSQPSLVLADEPTGALDSNAAKKLLSSFEVMNRDMNATILMVTHDTTTASYCKRILFINDGKIHKELHRGNETRKQFFDRIMELVTVFGGE